jgi:3,4-dihydroxy 2-butanone 4-phosphate synthase/GTP cyclohydrolase II
MAGNGDRRIRRRSDAPLRMEKVAEARLPTEIGEFRVLGFQEMNSGREYLVLTKGDLSPDRPCLVRIHSQCLTGDVFHSIKCDCGRQLRRAMELIEREGAGVLIYQQQEGRGIGLLNKIRAYELQDQGLDTVEANLRLGFAPDERSYEDCVAILHALGIRHVRLLSNNPHKIAALRKAGVHIVERVPLEVEPAEETVAYLRAKKEKLGHWLSSV